jgi:hypothetical protein
VQRGQGKLEDEIALVSATAFTIPIWINFDAAENQFYTDKRSEDCGKLVLSPLARARLEQVDLKVYRLCNVQLVIRTPFRILGTITIHSRIGTALNVRKQVVHRPIEGLDWPRQYLEQCRTWLDGNLWGASLDLEGLDFIAMMFRRLPGSGCRGEKRGEHYLWAEEPIEDFGEWAEVSDTEEHKGVTGSRPSSRSKPLRMSTRPDPGRRGKPMGG